MSRLKRKKGGAVSGKDEIEKSVREEADSSSGDDYNQGGKVKRAAGGKVPERKAGGAIGGGGDSASLAKRARGGRLAIHKGSGMGGKFARGGSPMSTAQHISAPGGGGAGHEGADHPRGVP